MGQFCCMYINEEESHSVEVENESDKAKTTTFTVEEAEQFDE